jgi:DNA-binding transcriptional LysR family regulator
VRDCLAAHPDEDFGPTQVGKALGRSQGAVSNALSRLEAAGQARLVSITPRRYRIAT